MIPFEDLTVEKTNKEQEIAAKIAEKGYVKIRVHFVSGEKYILHLRGKHVYVHEEDSSCVPYSFIATELAERLHERICGKHYCFYYE